MKLQTSVVLRLLFQSDLLENKRSSEILPAMLVCKMVIFALRVFPFSYLPHVFEENKTKAATEGRHW